MSMIYSLNDFKKSFQPTLITLNLILCLSSCGGNGDDFISSYFNQPMFNTDEQARYLAFYQEDWEGD